MSDMDTDPGVAGAADGRLAGIGVEDLNAAGGLNGDRACGDKLDISNSPDVTVAAGGCLTAGVDDLGAADGMTGIGGGGGRMNSGLVSGTWGLAEYLSGMTGLGALTLGDIVGRSLT